MLSRAAKMQLKRKKNNKTKMFHLDNGPLQSNASAPTIMRCHSTGDLDIVLHCCPVCLVHP